MAYIRTKNIKGNLYHYEQESYREKNQVKTRHIRYIGKAGQLGTTNKINDSAVDFKKIENKFGYTENPKEAGFIITNGKMIDFSGRRQAAGYKNGKPLPNEPDYLADSHSIDHREIKNAFNEKKLTASEKKDLHDNNFGYVKYFGEKNGAVRFFYTNGDVNAEFFKKPNEKQLAQISNSRPQKIYADIDYKKQGTYKGEYNSIAELKADL